MESTGNPQAEVKLYTKDTAWPAIFDAIDDEAEAIRYQTYLWRKDRIGLAVGEKLLDKANHDTDVHVVYDEKAIGHLLTEFGGEPFWESILSIYNVESVTMGLIYAALQWKNPPIPTGHPLRAALLKNKNVRLTALLTGEHVSHTKWVSLRKSRRNIITDMNTAEEYDCNWAGFAVDVISDEFHQRLWRLLRELEYEDFNEDKQLYPVANHLGYLPPHNNLWRYPTAYDQTELPFIPMQAPFHQPGSTEYKRWLEKIKSQCGTRELSDTVGARETNETLILREKNRIRIVAGYLTNPSILSALLTAMAQGTTVEILGAQEPNILELETKTRLKFFMDTAKQLGLADKLKVYLHPRMVHAKALQTGEEGNERLHVTSANMDFHGGYRFGELGVVIGPKYSDAHHVFDTEFKALRKEATQVNDPDELTTPPNLKTAAKILGLLGQNLLSGTQYDATSFGSKEATKQKYAYRGYL